jgi:hypothetical protein
MCIVFGSARLLVLAPRLLSPRQDLVEGIGSFFALAAAGAA